MDFNTIYSYAQKIEKACNTFTQTFIPACNSIMVLLLGARSRYSCTEQEATYITNRQQYPLSLGCKLEFTADDLQVPDAPDSAIQADCSFIAEHLKDIPDVAVTNITMDTRTGTVSIIASISIRV